MSDLQSVVYNYRQTIIRYIYLLHAANVSQAQKICDADLQYQSPSKVCRACLERDPNAVWLAWLKCTNQEEHNAKATVTVVVGLFHRKLVKVRELPPGVSMLSELALCCSNPVASRCGGDRCRLAHSQEELNYWKWNIVIRLYAEMVSDLMFTCLYMYS